MTAGLTRVRCERHAKRSKDFKRWSDPDLYTAGPPIDMLRFVVSSAVTGWSRAGRRREVMVNGVARAYFDAPSLKPKFSEICNQDFETGDKGECGELTVSMY